MRKFVYKSFIYLCLVLIVANLLAFMGLRALGNSDFFKTTYLVHHFTPSQAFGLTIFGSSRSLAAIDTEVIGEKMGGLAINFSMDNTALPSSLLMLKLFYNQGYTSEWVVISVDLPDFEQSKTEISENDHRFLPFVNDADVRDYFGKYEDGIVKPLYSSKFFPVAGFAYYNMELLGPAVQALINPNYKYRFDELGNYEYPEYLAQSVMPEPRYFDTALGNPILKEIQELTQANGSKLILYIAPYLRDDITVSKTSYTVINHSRLINEPKYFSDYIHVVTSGKKIATEAFTEDLNNLAVSTMH